jgi:hypothetical protein
MSLLASKPMPRRRGDSVGGRGGRRRKPIRAGGSNANRRNGDAARRQHAGSVCSDRGLMATGTTSCFLHKASATRPTFYARRGVVEMDSIGWLDEPAMIAMGAQRRLECLRPSGSSLAQQEQSLIRSVDLSIGRFPGDDRSPLRVLPIAGSQRRERAARPQRRRQGAGHH